MVTYKYKAKLELINSKQDMKTMLDVYKKRIFIIFINL